MAHYIITLGLAVQVMAAPTPGVLRRTTMPTMKSATVMGNVTDPSTNRDSCGSTRIGTRALWTCRDTMSWNDGSDKAQGQLVPNTASWTNLTNEAGGVDVGPVMQQGGPVGPGSTGSNSIYRMYGGTPLELPAYFPLSYGECSESGKCSDGTRWAIWPDSPVLITDSAIDGSATGYTWIPLAHIKGLDLLDPEPAYSLYKTSYTPNDDINVLPDVTLVDEGFYDYGQIGYGNYGGVVSDGYAYLYGQTSNRGTTLAKVAVGSVEDRSAYQYYLNGAWTSSAPNINDTSAAIPNAGAGGQGTFYYSTHLSAYVWIGQDGASNAPEFLITTAPAPEGPWATPATLYQGAPGDDDVASGYSLQAHPALLPSGDASENAIYLTYTQPWSSGEYVTPLIYVEFN